MAEILLGIGLLVFLSLSFTAVFQRTLLPDVLLLILLGILLGPAVLGWVKPSDFGKIGGVMSTIALVVILFESGTTLDIDLLARMLKTTLSLAVSTFAATVLVTAAAGYWVLHLDVRMSFLLGLILSSISPAVVIPIAKSLKMREPAMTVLILESGLTDVLSIVMVFSILGSPEGVFQAPRMLGTVLSSLVFAGVIGMAGGLAWAAVLNTVRQFPNTSFAVFAWVFILYGIADMMGFSGAIAALAFGASMVNHDRLPLHNVKLFQQHKLGSLNTADMEFYHEVIFLLKTFFFVYLGLSIKFDNPVYLLVVLVVVVVTYLARLGIVTRVMRGVSPGWEESYELSVMAPKGLAAAVLASVPLERGMAGGEVIQSFSYFVVLVSIVLTAGLIPLMRRPVVERGARRLYGFEPMPLKEAEEAE
ncbi:cation:proton antiporter [uncultured Paludibaculum sp.]|uniref:cation:proton antiporter domain-containing protein n=1 Tax=uncultured Paludibaculum sp. TaxID=1765020 RepID=UPI002AAAFC10|nr:cation:proton antiporter [uncultured Paludibaculum sp.]